MRYTDMQDALRHDILGYRDITSGGRIQHFDAATLDQLDTLAANGFLDLDQTKNSSPTVGELMDFMRKHADKGVVAHGYIVANDREDRRISLEGLAHDSEDRDFQITFLEAMQGADELDRFRAWWD